MRDRQIMLTDADKGVVIAVAVVDDVVKRITYMVMSLVKARNEGVDRVRYDCLDAVKV